MHKIRVGMIGAGSRAQTHYASLAMMNDVEIRAICELNEERLMTTAHKYGITNRFTDYRAMLEKTDLDAVYIIMSPALLDPLVTYCLRQSKHIFVEKPPGATARETKKWSNIARENGCKTMVGFQRRFHPCYREAKRILDERGRILYCMAAYHKFGEWKGDYDSLNDDVIHIADLLRDMGGDVEKIHSLNGQHYSNIESYLNFYTATLEFEHGGIGILSSNRTSGGRAIYFEMHAKGLSVYGNIPGIPGIDYLMILKDNQPYQEARTIRNEELVGSDAPRSHLDGSFQANRHFIECIKEDKQPLTNFEDATKTMKMIEEIRLGPRLASVVES